MAHLDTSSTFPTCSLVLGVLVEVAMETTPLELAIGFLVENFLTISGRLLPTAIRCMANPLSQRKKNHHAGPCILSFVIVIW